MEEMRASVDNPSCATLYNVLESIPQRTTNRKKTPSLSGDVYEFLKKEELIHFREIPAEEIREEEEAVKRLEEAEEKRGEVLADLRDLKNKWFVWGKRKKLSALEERLKKADEERKEAHEDRWQRFHQPDYLTEEREIEVVSKPGKVYAYLSSKGSSVLRSLMLMAHKDFLGMRSIIYGSEDHLKKVESFGAEEREFFSNLLERLNTLSDNTAKAISDQLGLRITKYDARWERGVGYADYVSVRYVRDSEKPQNSNSLLRMMVPEGYTGFIFDEVIGDRIHQYRVEVAPPNFELPEFTPKKRRVPVSPADLGNIIMEGELRNELVQDYELSVERFFSGWFYSQKYGEQKINPDDIPEGYERDYVIKQRGIDPAIVKEVEEKFPETRTHIDSLVERIRNARADKTSVMI